MEALLPVIVGGIIGLLGGLVGPPLAHWLGEGAARKKKRAEKLEELIGALYAFDHWLGLMRSINVWGKEATEPPSPFQRHSHRSNLLPEPGHPIDRAASRGEGI